MNVSTPPRLLIILNRFVIGGQAVDTLPLAHFLQPDFNILIVYGEKEKDEIEPLFLLKEYPGLKLKKISFLKRSINPLNDVAAFLQLIAVILTFRPSVVHTHGAKSGVLGRIAAFICFVPVRIHTFHGHLFHSYFGSKVSALLKFAEQTLAKITQGFIVLSPSQANDLVNLFNILPAHKCRIIPLGITHQLPGNAAQIRQSFRKQFHVGEQEIAIGIVGRIVPIKNHRFFVELIAKLLPATLQYSPVFFIVGDGELRFEIEQQLKTSGIEFSSSQFNSTCRVVFTSWLSNISRVMCGLDIIALTSMNEGTPLSIIEAQAFAKPVVATNVGGVNDTMLNDVTGFIVENGDLDGFAGKMELLINSAAMRKEMGLKGQAFVGKNFSKQREVDLTKEYYFSLLAQKHDR